MQCRQRSFLCMVSEKKGSRQPVVVGLISHYWCLFSFPLLPSSRCLVWYINLRKRESVFCQSKCRAIQYASVEISPTKIPEQMAVAQRKIPKEKKKQTPGVIIFF